MIVELLVEWCSGGHGILDSRHYTRASPSTLPGTRVRACCSLGHPPSVSTHGIMKLITPEALQKYKRHFLDSDRLSPEKLLILIPAGSSRCCGRMRQHSSVAHLDHMSSVAPLWPMTSVAPLYHMSSVSPLYHMSSVAPL